MYTKINELFYPSQRYRSRCRDYFWCARNHICLRRRRGGADHSGIPVESAQCRFSDRNPLAHLSTCPHRCFTGFRGSADPHESPSDCGNRGIEPTHTPTRRAGEACYYSDAGINQAATPIPDGAFSRYQGYRCDNGYWDIGTGDWVDKTGDWGKDGVLERAFTKFNRDGVEIDRMFFDLQGNRIPGPNK